MNDAENGSDIARLRRRIALEEEAAQRGLTGLAIVASHEIITARMERGAERILQLIEEGKHTEAVALMNTETWGVEEQEVMSDRERQWATIKVPHPSTPTPTLAG